MTADDVPTAQQLSDDAFYELDVRTTPPHFPEPKRRSPEHAARWVKRVHRFLDVDPDGCVVADSDDGAMLGFATSFVREDVWGLATFAVAPGLQGRGIGRTLLDAALAHGEACRYGMLSASVDPKAARRYRLAGFDLHPQMILHGTVDRTALPAVSGIRDGTPDDRELADHIVRTRRGGGHGPDHDALADRGRLLVATNDRGFAYTSDSELVVLAATDEDTARALLCEALAGSGDRFHVGHITGANQWAIEMGTSARLDLDVSGYLGVRGLAPPTTYVHNGALL